MSVLPGRQERRFVVATASVNPCHLVTRQVTVCHSLLWLGPRSAPGNSSQALSRRRDKIIFYRMRACVTRMECRFCIGIEFKYPGRLPPRRAGAAGVTVDCAAPRPSTFAVTLLALANPGAGWSAAPGEGYSVGETQKAHDDWVPQICRVQRSSRRLTDTAETASARLITGRRPASVPHRCQNEGGGGVSSGRSDAKHVGERAQRRGSAVQDESTATNLVARQGTTGYTAGGQAPPIRPWSLRWTARSPARSWNGRPR